MFYRESGFLARLMIWFFPPPLLSRQQVVSLSQSCCVSLVELTDGRGKGTAAGEKACMVLYNPLTTLWRGYPPSDIQ
jgi:hypothetical protein